MKQKLIDLYRSVITSNKNLIRKDDWYRRNHDDVFSVIAESSFGTGPRSFTDSETRGNKLHSKTLIVSGGTNKYYETLTYRSGEWSESIYYKEDLEEFYNGHEIEPTETIDLPMDKIYGVGIAFHGPAPNLLLYQTRSFKKLSKEEVVLDRYKYTLLGRKAWTIKYDNQIKYYLKFGSIYEQISEKDYIKLVNLALDNLEGSNEKVADELSNFYLEKDEK
jgi:hypothetical protein